MSDQQNQPPALAKAQRVSGRLMGIVFDIYDAFFILGAIGIGVLSFVSSKGSTGHRLLNALLYFLIAAVVAAVLIWSQIMVRRILGMLFGVVEQTVEAKIEPPVPSAPPSASLDK